MRKDNFSKMGYSINASQSGQKHTDFRVLMVLFWDLSNAKLATIELCSNLRNLRMRLGNVTPQSSDTHNILFCEHLKSGSGGRVKNSKEINIYEILPSSHLFELKYEWTWRWTHWTIMKNCNIKSMSQNNIDQSLVEMSSKAKGAIAHNSMSTETCTHMNAAWEIQKIFVSK